MAKKTETETESVVETAPVAVKKPEFTKEQLLGSKRYSNSRDLVNALLKDSDSKKYTIETVDKMIADYMKGKVN